MNLKWQKFFFHSSGGWKVQGQSSGRVQCPMIVLSLAVDGPLLTALSQGPCYEWHQNERSLFSQGYGLSFMTLSVCMLSCFSPILCPWDSPGKYTGVVCHTLLQGIFPTQGLNLCLLCLLHWQMGSLLLAPPRKPWWETWRLHKTVN